MRTRLTLMLMCGLAAILLAAGTAVAAPSLYGYTGLIRVPTADALDEDHYNGGLFTLNFDEDDLDSNNWTANLGLAPHLEVGFTRVDPDEGSSETWINGKYRFEPETGSHPALAVGVIDVTDESSATAYFVLSKAFGRTYDTKWGEITTPQVHLGAGGGQLEGVFGGVSATVAGRVLVMVEHDSQAINWGARVALSPEWRAHVAAIDGWDQLAIGVSFNKFM